MRTLLGCTLGLVLCCGLSADDKKAETTEAKKLVGKWALKKDGGKTRVEFTKDGKMTVVTVINEKEMKLEGTYKVDGRKLVLTVKVGEKEVERTRTINEVTDTDLVTTDEQGKKEISARVKDK